MTGSVSTRPRSARSTISPGLPVITKAQLQAEPEEDLLSHGRRKESLVTALTSGSTGRPFRTYRDPGLERWRAGYLLRALATAGYRLGDRLMIVVERPERPGTGWTRWRKLTFHDQPDHSCWPRSTGCGPTIVYGYVSALRQVVRLAQERGRPVHRPKAVVDRVRNPGPDHPATARPTVSARRYSTSTAASRWASSPGSAGPRGYHVAEDSVLVETAARRAAAAHRLLLTNLHNEAMPLIRYDQADLALLGDGAPCPCGRRFRRLAAIQGRVMDSILRPDGSHIPPFSITSAIREIPGLRRFQIVQERPELLTARVESDGPLDAEVETRRGRQELAEVLGPDMRIVTEAVATLEPPPGVKFRLIESRLGRSGG